jgi:peptide/nickel transport system ATP-binding protein
MAGSGTSQLRERGQALLRVEHLVRTYRNAKGHRVHAVSDVSFDVQRGETLGIVGESGCGKSTLAKSLMMLPPPSSGAIHFEQVDLTRQPAHALRALRPRVQMVFQDPVSSLNPRHTVMRIVEAPLIVNGIGNAAERAARVRETLQAVGLDAEMVGERRPHELSGGQCQRVSIARALVLRPALLVCDEPVSALDVSVQAQVINLLEQAKLDFELTVLFISHDLAVVKSISDRVMVMYLGKVCEIGPADALYRNPRHPYTASLLEAIPIPDPARANVLRSSLSGETPSPLDIPSGCRFHTRCPNAIPQCSRQEPELRTEGDGQYFACHRPMAIAVN